MYLVFVFFGCGAFSESKTTSDKNRSGDIVFRKSNLAGGIVAAALNSNGGSVFMRRETISKKGASLFVMLGCAAKKEPCQQRK